MPKFRKKPVVIEAEQFFSSARSWPEGVVQSTTAAVWGATEAPSEPVFIIRTLEGAMRVVDGDWVITGIKGERYPCKNEIFLATYEPVEG